MARLQIKVGQYCVELEGTEDFILNNYKEIINLANEIDSNGSPYIESSVEKINEVKEVQSDTIGLDRINDYFGEYYLSFDKTKMKDIDKTLIAAYYVQCKSETNDFSNREVNKELDKVGVKTNSTQNTTNNLKKKYVYKTTDKHFRVSEKGVEYLETLKID